MKYAQLICGLLLAILVLIVYVRQSIIDKKIYKFKLFLGFLLTGGMILIICFHHLLDSKKTLQLTRDIICIFVYIITGVLLFWQINVASVKSGLENEFIRSLEVDKVFVLLDTKDRIKQISTAFTSIVKEDKKNIIGKKFFDFFSKYFVLNSVNGVEMNLNRLKEYFKMFQEEAKPDTVCRRELLISLRDGSDSFVLSFNDTPMFSGDKYCGHLLLGEKNGAAKMLSAERELNDKSVALNDIKQRFQAYLSITTEAVYFYNIEENYIWGNDAFVKILNLNGNSIGKAEFDRYIHKDDLVFYKNTLSELTPSRPCYDIKYRYKTGNNYQFVRERAKRVFANGATSEIVGTIEIVNDVHYERSNIPALDNVKDETQLLVDIQQLYRSNKPFLVALFDVANLPEINNKHGRSMGNMILGEYVTAVKDKLVDDDYLYRVSGLEFAIIVSDSRKISLLQGMLQKGVITNISKKYGGIEVDIIANFGIAYYNDCVNKSEELLKCCYRALKTSKLPQVDSNYIYYRDIR